MSTSARSYSTTEVAQRLGISTQTVQRWVDTGQLKAWKTLGGHRRIEAEGAELLFRLHGLSAPGADRPADAAEGAPALSVLVVDDNPDDRDILAHLIEAALPHATVAAATNGFHGLIAIGRMAPDVLITDLLMPHMNGFEMLKHLTTGCAVKPRLILAVSSNTPEELASRGHLPSGVVFLQKPLDPERFMGVLRSSLKADA
ncbi:MAG TPA: response regulator [Aquabacterium sp.]|uniref:response regulator n=1 Tax=Aquabacterium sp. TaxID=1872578 RepID=UPI002E309DA7|nr:response regulator [Aquabacterium sp.]HEX5372965.1 response regulator [Aquabacterium sp.]